MLDPASLNFPEAHPHFSNHRGLIASGGYTSYGYGVRPRRALESYPSFGEEARLVNDDNQYSEESGASTPPLWRSSSPPTSPPHRQNHYRSLSPASRAQAIARGQRELMEMVSRMPEGCYELSLRDLVEHQNQIGVDHVKQEKQPESSSQERSLSNGGGRDGHRREKGVKKNEKKKAVKMNRSGSMDNGGFLLKMVFPVSLCSRKKKKNVSVAKTNSQKDGRVSPKPLPVNGSAKGAENEWWKNRFRQESGESESAGLSSSNSGSSKSSGSSSSRSSSRNSNRYGEN